MNDELSVCLLVTTYDLPEVLKVTLHSVIGQSVKPGLVVVADDGSGPETLHAVKEILGPSELRWCHVWHPRNGVRQSRIKNLAVRHADLPYLIFIDQDVVLNPAFIKDHLSMAEEGVFLQGKRALLPDHYTKRILADGKFISPAPWARGLGNRKNTLRFPALGRLLARHKSFQTSLRGCNLSMFHANFLKVDGFDETFDQSWGREDSDICYRLFHSDVRIKNLWFLALQYHLHHDVDKAWQKTRLDSEIQRILQEKRVKALKGFSRLSSEGEVIAASKGF